MSAEEGYEYNDFFSNLMQGVDSSSDEEDNSTSPPKQHQTTVFQDEKQNKPDQSQDIPKKEPSTEISKQETNNFLVT
jgi:hypothetical protein